jgi:hypothetical protein
MLGAGCVPTCTLGHTLVRLLGVVWGPDAAPRPFNSSDAHSCRVLLSFTRRGLKLRRLNRTSLKCWVTVASTVTLSNGVDIVQESISGARTGRCSSPVSRRMLTSTTTDHPHHRRLKRSWLECRSPTSGEGSQCHDRCARRSCLRRCDGFHLCKRSFYRSYAVKTAF